MCRHSDMTIKIGTRASKLALWQADFVASAIKKFSPSAEIELIKINTQGDKILDAPLAKIGGKGLFTKEIEIALVEKKIDLAVHSLKDVPGEILPEFKIAAITDRENPFDAFVSNKFSSLEDLPKNAAVGTSSLRRAAQILKLRGDLRIKNLRGNVETRLKKYDSGEFDAIILAAAGLNRLGYSSRIKKILTEIIPAAGQGALAIEIRADDFATEELIKNLNHVETNLSVQVERDFLKVIGGSCQIPVGIFAQIENKKISARAIILSTDGKNFIEDTKIDSIKNISTFGKDFAEDLLNRGGKKILAEIL